MKNLIIGAVLGVTLFGTVSSGVQVFAMENQTQPESRQVGVSDEIDQQKNLELMKKVGIELNEKEVTITDAQLKALVEAQGGEYVEGPNTRSAGVTKVVKRGNGSWDIYLSASFIRNYYWAAGAAASIIALMAPGVGIPLAATIIGSISGLVGSNTQHGVVAQIRNWKPGAVYRQ